MDSDYGLVLKRQKRPTTVWTQRWKVRLPNPTPNSGVEPVLDLTSDDFRCGNFTLFLHVSIWCEDLTKILIFPFGHCQNVPPTCLPIYTSLWFHWYTSVIIYHWCFFLPRTIFSGDEWIFYVGIGHWYIDHLNTPLHRRPDKRNSIRDSFTRNIIVHASILKIITKSVGKFLLNCESNRVPICENLKLD